MDVPVQLFHYAPKGKKATSTANGRLYLYQNRLEIDVTAVSNWGYVVAGPLVGNIIAKRKAKEQPLTVIPMDQIAFVEDIPFTPMFFKKQLKKQYDEVVTPMILHMKNGDRYVFTPLSKQVKQDCIQIIRSNIR